MVLLNSKCFDKTTYIFDSIQNKSKYIFKSKANKKNIKTSPTKINIQNDIAFPEFF